MALVLDGSAGVSGVDGTASNPSYEGTDSNTGIFYPAADTVAIGTGGTEALRVNSSQNVGLGVTPSAWGASWKSMSFNTVGAVASTTGVTRLYHNAFNNDSNNLYRTTAAASMYSQDGAHAWFIAPSGTAGNTITFTQAMTLDASGRLGLGTTSPTAGLFVATQLAAGTSSTVGIGIGSSASTATVELFGAVNGAALIDFAPANGSTDFSGRIFYDLANNFMSFATNATERARFDSSGNFVQNTGCLINSVGTYGNTTASAANMVSFAGGSFGRSTSALKYKQDIRDLESIDVNLFRAVRYKSKCENDDQTKDHFGIVADEVDAAGIKELVNYGAEGEVEGFQYERLTVVLLKAIQELNAKVEALEAQLKGNA